MIEELHASKPFGYVVSVEKDPDLSDPATNCSALDDIFSFLPARLAIVP